MCGIFGWIPCGRIPAAEVELLGEALVRNLRHRGPDDSGLALFSTDGRRVDSATGTGSPSSPIGLMLGHTRLSIIDLSQAGRQPMFTPDGRYCLVYNGEVYNYLELRAELEALGAVFHTRTDGEVVLQALAWWGEKALRRFSGMFALAFYDTVRRRLLCARDYFGIKPFYWRRDGAGFKFASELPALLGIPGDAPRANPEAVYQYLRFSRYDLGDKTFVQGVYSLPAGHYMWLCADEDETPTATCYWKPKIVERRGLSLADAASELRELLLESVGMHLRSDVPVGVALSGGLDSSVLTCLLRQLLPDQEILSFSFINSDARTSEAPWARSVSRHVRTTHHEIGISSFDVGSNLDDVVLQMGEPVGSTSVFAQMAVYGRAAEAGVKVMLDGQGADELFGGYLGFPGHRAFSLLRKGDLLGAWRFLQSSSRWPGRSRRLVFEQALKAALPLRVQAVLLGLSGKPVTPAWLDRAALKDAGVALRPVDSPGAYFRTPAKMKQRMAYQLTVDGLPRLLRHGDRSSMTHSVESRVPFLTDKVADFALSLPEEYLVSPEGQTKHVLREAVKGLLPQEILERKDKVAFITAESDWLRVQSCYVEELIASAGDVPFIRRDELLKEWQGCMHSGGRIYSRVWRWINYIRWVQLFKVA